MTSEQRKELQANLDRVIGFSLEKDSAHETIRDIRSDIMHTWLLLSILERLESIDESLVVLMAKEQEG